MKNTHTIEDQGPSLEKTSVDNRNLRLMRCLSSIPSAHRVAGALFIPLILLAPFNKGVVFNSLIVLLIAMAASYYVFQQLRYGKEIVFYSHVNEESRLQKFRNGIVMMIPIALAVGIILSLSLLVFLLTVPIPVLVVAIALPLLFYRLRNLFLRRLKSDLKENSRQLLANSCTVITLGVAITLSMMVMKWIQLEFFTNHELLMIPDEMAEHVMGSINYEPVLIQYLARTMMMFELELLRASHFAEGWFGTIIMLYFLLPSTLAAFAMPTIYAGILFICRGERARITPMNDTKSNTEH